jgi:hypothetical protein
MVRMREHTRSPGHRRLDDTIKEHFQIKYDVHGVIYPVKIFYMQRGVIFRQAG